MLLREFFQHVEAFIQIQVYDFDAAADHDIAGAAKCSVFADYYFRYTQLNHGSCAHCTRHQRRIDNCVCISADATRVAQTLNFSVRGRIAVLHAPIVAAADNFAVFDQYRTDRNAAFRHPLAGFVDGSSHEFIQVSNLSYVQTSTMAEHDTRNSYLSVCRLNFGSCTSGKMCSEVNTMLNKVLILSATSGNGHVRAGQALEKAFRETGVAREVLHVDALRYASPLMRGLYDKTYLRMVNNAPTLLGWIYDETDVPWHAERRRLAFDRVNTFPLARFINNYNPDLIVCTHFMPASVVSWLKAKKRIAAPQAVVVTDMDMHAMWMCRHYDHYFTAMDETREHLIKLGADADRISVTGIPIDPIFAQTKDKAQMRSKLGLAQDKAVIMLSAGGFGVGRMHEILHSLGELKTPTQVLAMCGKNQRLLREVQQLSTSTVEIIPVGFTDAMDEYMSAADILVGKPGGLTTSEALAKGLIMVIVNPIPGQEERNSDHLLEEGAAIRCNNLPALAFKIDRLLGDPDRLQAMHANVKRIARPNAAQEIVSVLTQKRASTIAYR